MTSPLGQILAIDPGNEHSAFVLYDMEARRPVHHGKLHNDILLDDVRTRLLDYQHVAIEMIASYGMPVGREVFDTCVYIGRLLEAWRGPASLVYRRDVKLHLCGSCRAKDPNVRAALVDRYGPGREKAIGKKHSPGPLYGVSADVWSALAVAVTWADSHAVAPAAPAGLFAGGTA